MQIEYGKGKWWSSVIQSYDTLKGALKGQGLEQNHLVHANARAVLLQLGGPEAPACQDADDRPTLPPNWHSIATTSTDDE